MRGLKIICSVVLIMVALLVFPNEVKAVEKREDLIKIIAPDGENAVFKMKKPTTDLEGDFNINGYVNMIFQLDDYQVHGGCFEAPYNRCIIEIMSDDYELGYDDELQQWGVLNGWKDTYTINVTYEEPKDNSAVSDIIDSLNEFDPDDPNTYYFIEDLSLVNYYLTSNKSELWNHGAAGRAIKYSTINNVIRGSNVSFYLDTRAGNQNDNYMFESAFGLLSVFYKGNLYETKEEGLYLKRIIYIPQTTDDSKEAYIEAAQKRINDYLGSNEVTVTYGGLISSLETGSENENYPITSDGNYYNIKIGNRTYKFYIVKGTEKQLVQPVYTGLDLEHNIEVTSDDSRIPLDTSLNVTTVEDSSLKNKIGTENYKSYDIILHSASKNAKIEKLENGKFLVKMPIPIELENKKLTVYYITEEGKIEEHEVTVKDGFVTFTTDHFSTYTLAEKVESSTNTVEQTIDNPETGDNIITTIITLVINILTISILLYVYQKKQKNINMN